MMSSARTSLTFVQNGQSRADPFVFVGAQRHSVNAHPLPPCESSRDISKYNNSAARYRSTAIRFCARSGEGDLNADVCINNQDNCQEAQHAVGIALWLLSLRFVSTCDVRLRQPNL